MKKNKFHQMEYFTLFSKDDIYLYKEGTHYRLYKKLGAHLIKFKEKEGVYFAIWAPNAQSVAVIGDFNQWQSNTHLLKQIHSGSGIWEGFISEIADGNRAHTRVRPYNKRQRKIIFIIQAKLSSLLPPTAIGVYEYFGSNGI